MLTTAIAAADEHLNAFYDGAVLVPCTRRPERSHGPGHRNLSVAISTHRTGGLICVRSPLLFSLPFESCLRSGLCELPPGPVCHLARLACLLLPVPVQPREIKPAQLS